MIKNITQNFRNVFYRHTLAFILITGAIFRIIAAFFSKGFLTLDDHHNFVIDADTIANGNSLPINYKDPILYPLIGAGIMLLTRTFSITSPDIEMLIMRIFHAAFSLLGIYFVYKILDKSVNKSAATMGGFIMATFYIIPVISVHQFEEAVCQVPLLASFWYFVITENKKSQIFAFISGIMLGFAVVFRLQLLTYAVPFVLGILIFSSYRKYFLSFSFGLIIIIILQSVSNIFVNGEFAYSFLVNFGLHHKISFEELHIGNYPSGPVWRYLLTLLIAFIPPFSIIFLFSSIRGGKLFPIAGTSTLIFFIVHSLIPNKQERFILPIIPLIILFAAAGYTYLRDWFEKKLSLKLYRVHWYYFWCLNIVLLLFTIFHYGKKDRVEPLVYISKQENVTGILIVQYSYSFLIPEYYLGTPTPPFFIMQDKNRFDEDITELRKINYNINYFIIYSDSIDQDQVPFEKALNKKLVQIKIVDPSLGDWLAHKLNPKYNKSKKAFIFKSI